MLLLTLFSNNMAKILVSGLINIETTCPIKGFPLDYFPIDYPFNQVKSVISGVGYNLITNLKKLNDHVTFASMTGKDIFGNLVLNELKGKELSTAYIKPILSATPQSVILSAPDGRREIYCDLKDYQEAVYDFSSLALQISESDLIIACNSNFNRPLVKLAKAMNKLIATDVHVLDDAKNEYNRDFMENSQILFLSDEGLKNRDLKAFVWELNSYYHNKIIVVGCGDQGALLFEAESARFTEFPAIYTRPVVATSGAGDTLFSTFLHFYAQTKDAQKSLYYATIAASYKIGEAGSSNGFLDESELIKLASSIETRDENNQQPF